MQKPYFWRAKTILLQCKKGVFEMQYPLNYLKYTKNSKNTYTTATIENYRNTNLHNYKKMKKKLHPP